MLVDEDVVLEDDAEVELLVLLPPLVVGEDVVEVDVAQVVRVDVELDDGVAPDNGDDVECSGRIAVHGR